MSMINDEAVAAIKTGENSTEEKAESAMPSMPGAGARSLLNHPSMPQMPEPTLKAIIEEIDSGSRRAVKRYWNNREVLKKLAVDMHLAVNEGHTVTALDRISGADIVHNPASVVDLEGPSGSPRSAKRYWNDKEVLIKLGVAINLAVTKDCTVEALEGIPGTDSVHQTASVDDVEMEFAQVRLDAGATVDALGPHKQKVAAFAAAVVQIYLDNAGDLGLIAKRIKSSNLDFTEFGDIFFEVVFTGGRIQPGTMKPNDWERHTYSVLDCEAKSEILLPSVIYIKEILRQKGFLTLNFRNIMQRFLGSLAYFEDNERLKLAIFTALAFSHKLPLLPETVFQPLLENDLVEKGFSLRFIADLFQEYLNKKNFNSLISIWKRGKVEDFFQFIRFEVRSAEDLSMRLFIAGMEDLVDFCDKINLEKFKAALATQISEIPVLIETSRRQAKDAKSVLIETSRKHAILVLIETSRRHAKDAGMPEKILLGVIMEVLTSDSDRWRGDVNKFERYVYSQVKPQWDLLKELCTTEVLQQELMNILQQYPPSLFCKLVRWLKSKSVISDCVILEWSYHRETQVKHLMSLKYIVIQLQDEEEDRVQRDLCSAQKRYEATKRQNPSSLISSPLIRITQHRCTTLSYSMRVNYLCHPADIDFPDPRYFS